MTSWSKTVREQGLLPYGILVLVLFLGAVFAFWTKYTLDAKFSEAKENARPAKIELVIIATPECKECFNIESQLAELKARSVEISVESTVNYPSDEANKLIETYGVERLPSAVISGEIDKQNIASYLDSVGERRKGALIWNSFQPVYLDVASGKLRGKVDVTHIKSDRCVGCLSGERLIEDLGSFGVVRSSLKRLDVGSSEAKTLIAKYKITKLPVVVLSPDARLYQGLAREWPQVGEEAADGSLVANRLAPPYFDLATGRVKGRVTATTLFDGSCKECIDPSLYWRILQNYGVAYAATSTVDIRSRQGIDLKNRYRVTSVPTLLMSSDVAEYSAIVQAWPQVGTTESDGTYVLRKLDGFGVYRNLVTGALVGLTTGSSSSSSP